MHPRGFGLTKFVTLSEKVSLVAALIAIATLLAIPCPTQAAPCDLIGELQTTPLSGASEVMLEDIQNYKPRSRFNKEEENPEEIKVLFKDLNRILSQIARAFNLNFEEMFKAGVSFRFKTAPLGPLSSHETKLGVFSNWSPQQGVTPDTVAAHEVGHTLAGNPERFGLPKVLKSLDSFFLFNEFFADWVAYKATGKVSMNIAGLPTFNLRPNIKSYDQPAGFFSGKLSDRELLKWVLEIKEKPDKTELEKRIAESTDSVESLKQKILETEKIDLRPLEDLENIRSLDSHVLGMPLFLFLQDLEVHFKRSLTPEFLNALKTLDQENHTDLTYDVYLKGYEEFSQEYVRIVVKTPRHFFDHIREQLTDLQERSYFDQLYQERKIEKGFRLEENAIMMNHIRLLAHHEMWERFNSNEKKGVGIYNQQNKYFNPDYGMNPNADMVIKNLN